MINATLRRRPASGVVVALAALLLVLTGCGDSEPEPPAPAAGGSLLPAGPADSTAADTTMTSAAAPTSLMTAATVMDQTVSSRTTPVDHFAETLSAPVEPATGTSAAEISTAEMSATKPNPFERRATAVTSAAGTFSLQLGSFTRQSNAAAQADRIEQLGYAPVIEVAVLGGETYHRIFLRGLADQAEASRLGEKIHAELGIAYLVRRTD